MGSDVVKPFTNGIGAYSQAAPNFYSAMLEAVESGKGAPKKADAAGWKGWLDGAVRRGEMKQSERDWLGVDAWLDGRDSTTRQELADFIRANQVQVQDVVLGDNDAVEAEVEAWWNDEGGANEETPYSELTDAERRDARERYRDEVAQYAEGGPDTKFASYQLPGGENYRELLLTLPQAQTREVDRTGDSFAGKRLDEVVGEEVADKILADDMHGSISGDGLKVGGDGMRGFYDSILPKAVNKWAKPFGAKVGETTIKADGYTLGDIQSVHRLDVTPAMRDAALQGLPLFSRADTPIAIDRAIIASTLGHGTSNPDYAAAKAGDREAGLRIAKVLVTDSLVQRVRAAIGDRKPVVVPVVSVETTGRNKIPRSAAEVLAQKLGLDTAEGITQANAPKRTALDGMDRIFAAPEFTGEVVTGQDYLLLDDTMTQGGTFAALASHIEANGGRVIAAVALTGKQYSATLAPTSDILRALREKHGDLESDFRAATGYGFDALTESEARYLANFKPTSAVRDRILAERGRRGQALGESATGETGQVANPQDPADGGVSAGSIAGMEKAPRPDSLAGFPDVLIAASESQVKQHEEYDSAKRGCIDCADSLVADTFPDAVLGQVKELLADRSVRIAAASAEERNGINQIPAAMARLLRTALGLGVADDLVQVNYAGHTGASGFVRLATPALFGGTVERGSDYLIVDDFIGQGGTIANLRGYIQSKGGNVVGAVALTGKPYSAALDPQDLIEQLREKHGHALETWWQHRFGYGFDRLTRSEARYLLNSPDADTIRTRIVEAGAPCRPESPDPTAVQEGNLKINRVKNQ